MVRLELGRPSRALAGGAALALALGAGCGAQSTSSDDDEEAAGASGESGSSGLGSGGTNSRGGTNSDGGTTSRGGTTGGGGSTNRGGAGGGGAGSGGVAGGALEDIATGEYYPYWLAIDDRYVFFVANGELRRVPLSGGDVVTLAASPGLQRVTAASGFAYFTDSLGRRVGRVDREGGEVEDLGEGLYPDGIFVDGESVYWTNRGMSVGDGADGSLAMTSIDGSRDAVLAEGLQQPGGVVVDDESVVFTNTARTCSASTEGGGTCVGGGLSRVPLAGGAPVSVDSEGTPLDVVLGEDAMYWVIDSPTRVKFAPRGGGAVQILATLSSESTGPLAVDAQAVYLSSAGDGRVVKIPLDGSAPFPVAVDLGYSYGVAVDDEWVYIAASSQGRIVRVKKDGSAADPGGPITGPCPTPIGTAERIAATPRADQHLEFLALELDAGEVTATDETYERVTIDVARIRELAPDLADIDHTPRSEGKSLIMMTSDIAGKSMLAGDYSAWDCLNEFYGLESLLVEDSFIGVLASVELKGNYGLDVLASVYAELPGIEGVDPSYSPADGPTICAERDGDIYEYVVDRAGGDCLFGCTTHDAHHFRSTAPGEIEVLETWNSESGASAPDWFTRVCR